MLKCTDCSVHFFLFSLFIFALGVVSCFMNANTFVHWLQSKSLCMACTDKYTSKTAWKTNIAKNPLEKREKWVEVENAKFITTKRIFASLRASCLFLPPSLSLIHPHCSSLMLVKFFLAVCSVMLIYTQARMHAALLSCQHSVFLQATEPRKEWVREWTIKTEWSIGGKK